MKRKILLITIIFSIIALMVVIPNVVFAEDMMSEEFKKLLNEDGKLVFNSIKPKNEDEWIGLFEPVYYQMSSTGIINAEQFNEDFTSCIINLGVENEGQIITESHRVEVVYEYNEKIKKVADELSKKLPKDNECFEVRDMELVNYWVNGINPDGTDNFDDYSGELKAYTDYKNFSVVVDVRKGRDDNYLTMRGGFGHLKFNDTTYYIDTDLEVRANHIIYVPDETESTKEALVEAAQKRVDEYIGEGKVKIVLDDIIASEFYKEYIEGIVEDYNNTINYYQNELEIEKLKSDPDEKMIEIYEKEIEFFKNEKEIEVQLYKFLLKAEGNYTFKALVGENEYSFIVIKDTSKMVVPKYKTSDLITNVEISSESSIIPLDTNIEAEKLISGTDFERIIKVLNTKQFEMFDLNLYSDSMGKYITKLDDGTFEVKIPVPDNFKDKELSVYYVDSNDEPTEFKVEVENGYAVFTTNHFSIYTLVAEEKTSTDKNIDKDTHKQPSVQNQEPIDKDEKDDTPQTGGMDILSYVFVLAIAILGVGILALKRK